MGTTPSSAAVALLDRLIDLIVDRRGAFDLIEGGVFRSRKDQEQQYLLEIERRFRRLPRAHVRQLSRDVYGLASLARISEQPG